MRIFILTVILSLFGCSLSENSSAKLDASIAGDSLTDSQKESLITALKLIFADPATGKIKTGAYKAYLEWQDARIIAAKNILDAQSDGEKMIWARKLTRLDENFTRANPTLANTIDTLDALGALLFQNSSSADLIKQQNEQAYTDWQKERLAIVDSIKTESDDQKKMLLVARLNLLDRQFKFQFLGLLINL